MEMLKSSLIKSIYVAGLGSVLLFSSVSCTKATPKMEQLKSLSGLAVTSKVVSINNGAVATMTGTCSKVFTDFEISFDNGEWVAAKDLDPNLQNNCTSSGTFTISFDSSNPIYADDLALQPASVTAAVRGLSEYGKSTADSMVINIIYAGAAGAPNPPTGINLYDPLIAISTDNTPSVSVSGVVAGDYVKVFTDGSCSVGNQVGGDVAAGPTAIIQLSTLADGNYTFYANSTNGVGPSNCSAVNVSYTVDTTAAYVTNVTASTANGSYKTGTVDVQITFSEAVTVNTGGGTPRLKLNSNASAYANYSGGSGTNTLTFTYSIAAGHNSSDLDYDATTALELNGGNFVDQVLLSSNLTLPSPGAANSLAANKAIVVDTLAPTLNSISFNTASGTYGPNTDISLTLTFSEPVTTTGTPTLTLSNSKTTTCTNISNSLSMTCVYNTGSTGSGSTGNNLSVASVSLSASDAATNSFAGTMPGNSSSINIDTTAPTITGVTFTNSNTNCVGSTCGPGEVITVTLYFSKNITAAAPTIDFDNGQSTTCTALSASNTTGCTYTVGATGSGSDTLDLTVTGISITASDAYGNTLDATLPTAASGLGIDTTAPVITAVTSSLTNGTYNTLPYDIYVELNFDESVGISGGTPFVRLNTVPSYQSAYYYSATSTSNKKVFHWPASAGNHSTDLDVVSVSLGGGSIKDLYGNDADLNLPVIAANTLAGSRAILLNYILDTTVDPIYSNYWNDYVKNDGTLPYPPSNIPCDTASDYIYGSCIHAGEKKMILVPGFTDCADLTLTESLNVFNWDCRVVGSDAIFYTLGLREGKGLKDLVDSVSWKINTISISSASLGMTVVTSSTGMTWDNAITNAVSSILSSPSTVYVVDTNLSPTTGIQIAADKVALVVKTGFAIGSGRTGPTLSHNCNSTDIFSTADTFALVYGANLKHLWIEGRFNAKATYSANFGLLFAGLKFSRFHNIQVGGTAYTSSYIGSGVALLNGSSSNMINDSSIANTGANGIYLGSTTSYNTIAKASVSNGGGSSGHGGINLASGSTNNYISRITVFNYNHTGIYVNPSATNNLFSHITTANNGTAATYGKGISLAAGNNTVNQVLAVNNYKVGLDISAAHNSQFSQIVLVDNGNASDGYFSFSHSSDNTVFKYNFIIKAGTCPLTISGTQPGIAQSTCAGQFASTAGAIPFYLNTSTSLTTTFKGYLSTADTTNTTTPNPGPATPTDYVRFDNLFRGWGLAETDITAPLNKGKCASGCKIMDWSYSSGDTLLRNSVGANKTSDPFIVPNPTVQNCPASVNGNVVMTSLQSPAVTFLVNAVEIIGDGVGNENGLCQLNERCIYTPNYGSYIGGHEQADLKLCNFKSGGGPVTGVTMYGYSNNGY